MSGRTRGGRGYVPRGVVPGRGASTPERIDDWLARRPPHAAVLLLAYEGLNGLEEIEQMECKDIPAEGAGELLLASAQDHCDDVGQVGRYLLQLRTKDGGACGAKPIRVVPQGSATADIPGIDAIEGASVGGIIGQALRHNETIMRMYVNSMGSVLGRMHDLLRLEQSENENLRRRLREQMSETAADEEVLEEERQTRREILDKLGTLATDVVVPALAQRWANGSGRPPEEGT